MAAENTPELSVPSSLVIGGQQVDGRTKPAQRYKAVCFDLAQDTGGEPTTGQWLLIQRAAGLTVQIELLEIEIVQGNPVDVSEYTSLTGKLIQLLNTLGLSRKAKEINPRTAPLDGHARAVKAAIR
jgi:hypothetical protein